MKMRKVFQAAIMLVLSFGPLPCSFGQIWLELGGNFRELYS